MAAEQLTDIEKLHAGSKIMKVKLDHLKIDGSYQRDPSMRMADQIAEKWNELASELLLVSDRGTRPEGGDVQGGLFIVNGQHRSIAAKKRGMTEVDARVIDLSDHPDPASVEATLRLHTNVRLGDKPLERFKAQVRAGDVESLAIVDLLAKFGTQIAETANDGGINAVTVVEKLYRVDDTGALLRDTLELIRDTYGGVNGDVCTSPIMLGFAWFILKHADETDRGRLASKVGDLGKAALDRRARISQTSMSGTLWMNYYREIVSVYNEKLQDKSKLEWKLRGSSQFKAGAGQNWGNASFS